jgi:hypothetical protein
MKKISAAMLCLCLAGNALAQQPAAPAPAATTPPAAAAPAQNAGSVGDRNSVYTDRIPPEQILALDANGDKFLARHIPDLSGLPRGAAIILHDSAQNPAWPFTAAALSDDLPLHGWDTLSIELPAPDTAATQSATAPTPAAPAAATPPPAATPASSAQAPAGIEPRVQARIAAALKYYSDQQINNVVLIGFGSGTIRSAEFLRQYAAANANKLEPISALVMVMPLNKLIGIENDLPKILPSTAAPALDVILDSEPQAKADAEARRRAVLHQRERIYRQLQLPPINSASDPQHSLMVKRVRAWLQQNASAGAGAAKGK